MDLSLLPHLSDAALREEATRRGLDPDGLDRGALIAAIQDAEASAGANRTSGARGAPGGGGPSGATSGGVARLSRVAGPFRRGGVDALAATVPSPSSRSQPGSGLGAARTLLGRVVSMARTALPRRSSTPPAPAPEEIHSPEPIATRTMAELLIEQGHFERAAAILRKLATTGDRAIGALLTEVENRLADDALRARATARLEAPGGSFVELLGVEHGRGVVWRSDEASLSRGRALLGAPGQLTLRVVQVVARDDLSVSTRWEDHPVQPSGWRRIDAPATARLVVSLGLSEGAQFVSIRHTTGY